MLSGPSEVTIGDCGPEANPRCFYSHPQGYLRGGVIFRLRGHLCCSVIVLNIREPHTTFRPMTMVIKILCKLFRYIKHHMFCVFPRKITGPRVSLAVHCTVASPTHLIYSTYNSYLLCFWAILLDPCAFPARLFLSNLEALPVVHAHH